VRIVVDGTPLAPGRSGIGRWTYGVMEGLLGARPQAEVEFLGFRDARVTEEQVPEGTAARTLPWSGRLHRALLAAHVLPRLETYAGAADVMLGAGFVPWPAGRAVEVPVIHDLSYLRHPETVSPRFRRYLTFAVPRALRRSPRVVTVSEAIKAEINEVYRVEQDRIDVVPNSGESWASSDRPPPKGIPARYLLVVGTLEPRKNVRRILDAYRVARSDHDLPPLVLAGGTGRLSASEKRALDAAETDGVISLGYVSDDDLAALYTRATALVFASLYEGFGIPILEAMSAGCPVITSDSGAMSEVAGDAALLVDPYDTDAIADAIGRIVEDDGLARDLASRGEKRAAEYSWASSGAALARVLDQVTDEGRRS
jgi:glycosyltransferase involved in cell wall biosynthesis